MDDADHLIGHIYFHLGDDSGFGRSENRKPDGISTRRRTHPLPLAEAVRLP
jgi:hypothetical protein